MSFVAGMPRRRRTEAKERMAHMSTMTKTRRPGADGGTGLLLRLSERERKIYERIPEQVHYVWDPFFASDDAEEALYGPDAERIDVPAWTHFPEVPEDIRPSRSRRIILSARDEATLFRRFNYARYRLHDLIDAQRSRKSAARAGQMVLWYERVLATRAQLARGNMALVPAMAKRTRIPGVEFSELVSEGNMALLRSVEKFDVSLGYKFSTYACRAILKSFNRLATKTGRYRRFFPTEFDPDMERSDYSVHKHEMQREYSLDALRDILSRNHAALTDLQRTVVMERFGIASGGKGRTLSEVGRMVGLTNERVRQIQRVAISKIRLAMERQMLTH
jgi:RNA polymerase sigma factor (sigma-70 family)